MDVFLGLAFFLALGVGLWGLLLALFSSRRRRRGLRLMAAGTGGSVLFPLLAVMFGLDHAPSGPAAGAGAPVSLADQTDAATATRPPGARPIGRPESVTVAAVAEAAEERALLRGDRCFSAWDGSHTGLVRVLRDNLRNPSSFQHVSTARTKSAVPGTVTIIMTYRAQNGFGGMNIERIKATFEPRSCMVLDLAEMRG